MIPEWYGAQASWWVPLERSARRLFGDDLQIQPGRGRIRYLVLGLRVPGADESYEAAVHFYADPPYPTYGLPPAEFPRVYADPPHRVSGGSWEEVGQAKLYLRGRSEHRHPDGGLCLWHPHDPPHQRWRPELGLLTLIELTVRHLFAEKVWRRTGHWPLLEAPHGLRRSA